jgi:NADPH:quinone reductase-like Zn-dependent oxidoreductase
MQWSERGTREVTRCRARHRLQFVASINAGDLIVMRDLIEAHKVTPVIDRRFALSEVALAVRYLKEGHARGKVVITVQPPQS